MEARRVVSFAVVGLLLPALAAPQALPAPEGESAAPTVARGDRVRIELRGQGIAKAVSGTVAAVDERGLSLETESRPELTFYGWPVVESIHVRRGPRSGAGQGAIAGAVLLGVLGGLAGTACNMLQDTEKSCAGPIVGGAVFGAYTGAVLGAVVGSAFKGGHWVKVEHPRGRVSIGMAPTDRGVKAAVTLRF